MEWLGGLFFLIVGICGCIYPFLTAEKNSGERFEKSDIMYCDGDNT